ncbi:MAG: putative addiction module antidote protein [Gammaproteobacteria bacterium RIFOXYA12_FULL_61_12]|nr:MAG: putative addiction module antidote protein [Gammaproteobacteria bacterium RIFOXYD12_FULL_61_37]OGT93613.1 MAG: putative addiction module antidote protein [Gammaproteobacteria bacterium RIFOXYA12_FULL_61_12]
MPKRYAIYDPADHLNTPEAIADYINAAMEEGDDELLLAVLGDVARATRNMSALSRETGVSRETLYKSLSADGNPRFTSLVSILRAFGLELTVKPRAHAH